MDQHELLLVNLKDCDYPYTFYVLYVNVTHILILRNKPLLFHNYVLMILTDLHISDGVRLHFVMIRGRANEMNAIEKYVRKYRS
jgi:Tfp pilus assembly protein PilZ